MAAVTGRGIQIQDLDHFTIGQLTSYVLEWNEIHRIGEENKKPRARKATQEDWNALAGI